MRKHNCSHCGFGFSEADKYWDQVARSGHCPKCHEALRDFPVLVNKKAVSEESVEAPKVNNENTNTKNSEFIFCPYCGAELLVRGAYCSSCGNSLALSSSSKDSKKAPLASTRNKEEFRSNESGTRTDLSESESTVKKLAIRFGIFVGVYILWLIIAMMISRVLMMAAGESWAIVGIGLIAGSYTVSAAEREKLSSMSLASIVSLQIPLVTLFSEIVRHILAGNNLYNPGSFTLIFSIILAILIYQVAIRWKSL